MAEVFLCQTGQLTNASRSALRKAGVVVVEVEDPTTCQFIRSSEVVSSDDMMWAAVEALCFGDGYTKSATARERMTYNLMSIINEERARRRKAKAATDAPA